MCVCVWGCVCVCVCVWRKVSILHQCWVSVWLNRYQWCATFLKATEVKHCRNCLQIFAALFPPSTWCLTALYSFTAHECQFFFSTPQFVFSYLDEACLYHTQCTCISLIPTDNARSKPLLNVKMDGYDEVSHLWYWCQLRDWNCSEAVHNLHNTIQQGNSTVFLYQAYFICIDFCWQALLSEGCCFRTGIPHIGITRSLLKLFWNHLAVYCSFIPGACPTTWGEKKTLSTLNSTFFGCLQRHNGA